MYELLKINFSYIKFVMNLYAALHWKIWKMWEKTKKRVLIYRDIYRIQ